MDYPKTAFEQVFYTTVRIGVKYNSQDKKDAMGTGFFISLKEADDKWYIFLCTCKHLIDDAVESVFFMHTEKDNKIELGDPLRIELESFKPEWIISESYDIAILSFAPILNHFLMLNTNLFYRAIDISMIPDSKTINDNIDGVEKVYFIGYPDDKYDKTNMIPLIRTGITASQYSINYDGLPRFIIDASIFEGSSGSPVMIIDCGSYTQKGNGLCVGNRYYFLGMLTGRCQKTFEDEYIDLGIVCKSNIIKELIIEYLDKNGLRYLL